jgi:hypothetical protein
MSSTDSADSQSDSGALSSERRTRLRYSFVATAELTESASAMQLSGRVTEINRSGCYVDILNALPVGTSLTIHISCDQGSFVTKGKVVHIQERIGMGVAFLDPPEDQLKILDSWLQQQDDNS